jgi:hypothetical protein
MYKSTVTLCLAALAAGLAVERPAEQSRDIQFEGATIRPSGTFNAWLRICCRARRRWAQR